MGSMAKRLSRAAMSNTDADRAELVEIARKVSRFARKGSSARPDSPQWLREAFLRCSPGVACVTGILVLIYFIAWPAAAPTQETPGSGLGKAEIPTSESPMPPQNPAPVASQQASQTPKKANSAANGEPSGHGCNQQRCHK